MRHPIRHVSCCLFIAGCLQLFSASLAYSQTLAQTEAVDPLALESAPVEEVASSGGAKLFVEGSLGSNSRRYGLDDQDTRRASFDFTYSGRAGPGLRVVFSDRIDSAYPAMVGSDVTVNSLREAYLSWQIGGDNTIFDVGRINVRSGPGYGYNPTDFFRDGSLRVITSADPFALRRNRMGSVMLRGQHLWADGSISVAYSPKLASRPSADGWSLDLGSTNNRSRGLITLGTKFSQNLNTQLMLYKEDGLSPTVGVNMTALLSDAAVAHLEWTRGREPDLRSRILATRPNMVTRNRFVGGLSYTTLSKTSITAEYQYNGFGLDEATWSSLGSLGSVRGTQMVYLSGALRLQELAHRQAFLIYISQNSLWLKDLDFTAYLRFNPGDHSKLAWLELRHHWSNFDLTFQLQQNIGRPSTEFGLLPDRRVIQFLGTYYF